MTVDELQARIDQLVRENARLSDQLATARIGLETMISLFESAPVPMMRLDRTLRFRRVNDAYAGLVGVRASQLRGATLFDLLHPDEVNATSMRHALLLGGDLDHFHEDTRYLGADGSVLSVRGSMFSERGPAGTHQGTIGFVVPKG